MLASQGKKQNKTKTVVSQSPPLPPFTVVLVGRSGVGSWGGAWVGGGGWNGVVAIRDA